MEYSLETTTQAHDELWLPCQFSALNSTLNPARSFLFFLSYPPPQPFHLSCLLFGCIWEMSLAKGECVLVPPFKRSLWLCLRQILQPAFHRHLIFPLFTAGLTFPLFFSSTEDHRRPLYPNPLPFGVNSKHTNISENVSEEIDSFSECRS